VVKHLVGGFGPHKRLAAFVPAVDERGDCLFEVGDASEVPRRMAWRVMIPKKISTMLSQDPDVGVKCKVIRGLRVNQACTLGCLWVP